MQTGSGGPGPSIGKTSDPNVMNPTASTFSHVAGQRTASKRDYAIVIDSVEGLIIDDYLDGLQQVTDLNYVKYISKISGGRVCVYLDNEIRVGELKNKVIIVKDYTLIIKPLINKNKRVVISNVQPIIPNELIVTELKKKGITILSHISEIRASSSKPGRSHIMSFRRQFYIREEDEIPTSLQLTYDNTTFWTYLSTESASCFSCNKTGHIAKVCPNVNNHSSSNTDTNTVKIAANDIVPSIEFNTVPLQVNNIEISKRPLSLTISEGSSELVNNISPLTVKSIKPIITNVETLDNAGSLLENTNVKGTNKKINVKRLKPDSAGINGTLFKELLKPAKEIFDDIDNPLPMTFSQFSKFLQENLSDESKGEESQKFTDNITVVCEVIDKAYPLMTSKGDKSKLTKIKNKLINRSAGSKTDTSHTDTDMECQTTQQPEDVNSQLLN